MMIRRVAKWLGIGLGSAVLLYVSAAFIASFITRNHDWQQPPDGITIYVVTNGYHTGLILPVAAAGEDWSLIIRPIDLPDPQSAGNWMLFGWGDREFYLNTPTLADVKFSTALSALWGSGHSLLHVDHLNQPSDIVDPRAIRLSPAAYQRLTAHIRKTLVIGTEGRAIAMPGYDHRDVFYEARGSYNLFTTCNVWTSNALAAAGVRTGLWTPFSDNVMMWHPKEDEQKAIG